MATLTGSNGALFTGMVNNREVWGAKNRNSVCTYTGCKWRDVTSKKEEEGGC